MTSRLRGPIAWCVLAAALFGASTPLAKLLLAGLGPFTLAGLFYLGGALAVLPFARGPGSPEARRARGNRARLALAVLLGGAVGPVLLFAGLARAGAATVALLLNLETVFTALFARAFFGESLGGRGLAGVALVIAASLLLAVPVADLHAVALTAPSVLAVAGACACWGLDNNLIATVDGFTPAQSTAVKGLVAGTANLGLGLALEGTRLGLREVASALGVGALAYGASIVLYVAGAQQLGATRSQAIFSSAPFFGVALAWLVLDEPLGIASAVAGGAMVLAVVLLHSDVHSHAHSHARLVHTHWHRHDDAHHDHEHARAAPPGTWHAHEHAHEPTTHEHPHRPDLHHRH